MNSQGLQWVLGEVAQCLNRADLAIEAYMAEPGREKRLQECAQIFYHLRRVFLVLDVSGAALVMREAQGLSVALARKQIEERDKAVLALSRFLKEFPTILDHARMAEREDPLLMVQVANGLRVARGKEPRAPELLFDPELWMDVPELSRRSAPRLEDLEARVKRLRPLYQHAFKSWAEETEDVKKGLAQLDSLMATAESLVGNAMGARLWWVARAVIEAINQDGLAVERPLQGLLAKLDAELSALAADAGRHLAGQPQPELLKSLLFQVAKSTSSGERVRDVRRAFALQDAGDGGALGEQTSEDESAKILSTLQPLLDDLEAQLQDVSNRAGPDRSAADTTVYKAMAAELRSCADAVSDLALYKLKGSLIARASNLELHARMGTHPRSGDVMRLAELLLQTKNDAQAAADAARQRDPDTVAVDEDDIAAATSMDEPMRLEPTQLVIAVISETKGELFELKQILSEVAESPGNQGRQSALAGHIARAKGAMMAIGLKRTTQVLADWESYVNSRVLSEGGTLERPKLESLADTILSIEKSLDRVLVGGEDSPATGAWLAANNLSDKTATDRSRTEDTATGEAPMAKASDVARSTQTGTWIQETQVSTATSTHLSAAGIETPEKAQPKPLTQSAAAARVEDVEKELELWVEPSISATANAGASTRPAAQEGIEVPGNKTDMDEEMLEILEEEVAEIIEGLDEIMPKWMANPSEGDSVSEIRRAFHTVKGSGRMVGAMTMGELAWSVESLVNLLMAGKLEAGPEVTSLVNDAYRALPALLKELRHPGESEVDTGALIARAQGLIDAANTGTAGASIVS